MTDFRIVEETSTGWRMGLRSQDMYWDDTGSFVSREDYVAERESSGYGTGGYGE